MEHKVKILPQYFQAAVQKIKPFEIRFNDRGYCAGDYVCLQEWDTETGYTGAQLTVRIQYVLTDVPGLEDGYCIWSWEPVTEI